jgi:hypothetical protein
VAWRYSPTHLREKLCLSWCGEGMTNTRRVLVRGEVSTKGAQIGERVVTRACAQKTCST